MPSAASRTGADRHHSPRGFTMSTHTFRRRSVTATVLTLSLLGGTLATGALTSQAAFAAPPASGPTAPQNPFTAPAGGASTHGDSASSKVFTGRGPAGSPVKVTRSTQLAAFPTLLHGSDGVLLGLGTEYIGQAPALHVLDKTNGNSLAKLPIAKGSLLGGVYAYVDNQDRVVIIDGNRDLVRIAHTKSAAGSWQLSVVERTSLSSVIPAGDSAVGVVPAYDGRVWFVTAGGKVGAVDTTTGAIFSHQLPNGEKIANSISTVP